MAQNKGNRNWRPPPFGYVPNFSCAKSLLRRCRREGAKGRRLKSSEVTSTPQYFQVAVLVVFIPSPIPTSPDLSSHTSRLCIAPVSTTHSNNLTDEIKARCLCRKGKHERVLLPWHLLIAEEYNVAPAKLRSRTCDTQTTPSRSIRLP